MSFFIFLIFIILFIVAIPLLRIAAALINMKSRVANAFGGKEKPGRANEEPQRRKVYDKNVGEYVKFEEIAVDKSDDTPMEKVEYREESQVSDVEFEEIRD